MDCSRLRIALVVLALVLALLVGGLLAVPPLVAWEDHREALSRRVEILLGQDVAISGPIEIRLLPRPLLSLVDVALGPSAEAPILAAARLDLRLEALPLLGGELQIDEIHLLRPVLHLEAAADGTIENPPAPAALPDELTVVDGRVILRGADGDASPMVEDLAFELSADGQQGPFAVDGRLAVAGQPFAFQAELGRIGEQASAPLQLEVSVRAGEATASASFSGLASWPDRLPGLEGRLSLQADDARSTIAMLGRIAGRTPPPLPAWSAAPLQLEATLGLVGDRVRLDQASLEIADHQASGELDLRLAPEPSLDLAVDLERIDLPERPDPESFGLAAAAALPAGLAGRIDLAVDELGYREGVIRRLRATLLLSGSNRLTIEQARALLPGRADVSFTGVLVADASAPELHGTVTALTNDFRDSLAWLGFEPAGIPDDRLRSFSLSGALSVDRQSLRLAEAELRVDTTRITGSASIGLGARRQAAVALAADRVNLDAYRQDWTPGEVAGALRRWLGRLDLAFEAEIDRLIAAGRHLEQVALDGRVRDARLRLDELALRSATDTRMQASGEVDLESGSFDLAASLESERPTSFLRRLGVDPPLLLARVTPLTLRGSARGTPEAFDLDLELSHEAARLAVRGEAGWAAGAPSFDLALDAGHPDLPALLRRLGVVYLGTGEVAPKAFSLTGKLQGASDEAITVVGSARLGTTSLTGRVSWRPTPGRPRVSAQLSLGEPQADELLALSSLAGMRLRPPLVDEPPVGDWPGDALALGWMDEVDGELELSAKGGMVGPGLRLEARLEDRRLIVDELTTRLWNGEVEIQALLDARRRLPFLALAVDLRAIDPTRLGAWLDLAPVVQGSANLYLEATAAGRSLRDMVRGLIGRIDVTLHDGQLAALDGVDLREALRDEPRSRLPADPTEPIPLDRLAGSFQVKRGIASADGVQLALDGVEGRLVGEVDLLIWAADLTLELARRETGAVVLEMVGPLGRPQVRLESGRPAPETP